MTWPGRVRWWQSLRLRISAAVAAVTIVVLAGVGVVVDNNAAVQARERLRDEAFSRLDAAALIYLSSGAVRFGATTAASKVPAPMRPALTSVGQQAAFYDGTTMYAAQYFTPTLTLGVAVPGADLATERNDLRGTIVSAGLAGATLATMLGALVGTWLSRRLRAGAQAAGRIAVGEKGIRARQRGRDEVAALTVAVDDMAEALQRRIDIEKDFTADVAHELRSPVTALVSASELLPEGSVTSVVQRQVWRLRRLVEDLLEVSRLESGVVLPRIETIDSVSATTDALEQIAAEATLVARAGAQVEIDPRRFERILANFVTNAARHGNGSALVTVDEATVTVEDDGPGYPEEVLRDGPRRFSTHGHGTGSGLGLMIALEHARSIGALIHLDNRPEGGARATITLRPSPSGTTQT